MTQWQYVRSTDTVTNLICSTNLALGHIKMPSSVTSLNNNAFNNCPAITSVDLGSVTTIGGYAFYRCSSLNSVTYIAPPILEDTSLVLVDQDGDVQAAGDT